MPEQAHSPEPWQLRKPGYMADIMDANDEAVCYEIDASLEDMRRIVACVNFLKGISTEDLEAAINKALLR
jgi:hypothetical protein